MTKALFNAANQSLLPSGILVLVFASKTTAAWETLVQSLLTAGLQSDGLLAASHRDDGRNGQNR